MSFVKVGTAFGNMCEGEGPTFRLPVFVDSAANLQFLAKLHSFVLLCAWSTLHTIFVER